MTEDEPILSEGMRLPGWQSPFEASIMGLGSQGLELLVSMPYLRKTDISDFQTLNAYGIYEDTYPLVLWKFGTNFIIATPCNPEFEKQETPCETVEFFTKKSSSLARILIDQKGIIRVFRKETLKQSFSDRLMRWLLDEKLNWKNYNTWVTQTFKTPTHNLLEKSRLFIHGKSDSSLY